MLDSTVHVLRVMYGGRNLEDSLGHQLLYTTPSFKIE